MTMPAVSTTPPTTISLAAIVFAVSGHVTKSAAHDTNRQLMAFDNTLAMMKRAVVLLSGGIDSTTALAVARQRGFETFALSFRYGQRHAAEVEAARCVARALGAARHEVIAIDLRAFGGSALTADIAVPKDRSIGDIGRGIPVTYVPARNTIFLSYALAWAEVLGAHDIFLGVSEIEYGVHHDSRPEHVGAFERMANLATKAGVEGGQKLKIHTPLIHLTKAEIIAQGAALGVDFALTLSCYDPTPDGAACGRCDACLLRRKGFAEAGLADPTRYRAG